MAGNTHTMQSWSSMLEFPYHEIITDKRVDTEAFDCKRFSYRDHTVIGVAYAMLMNKIPEGQNASFISISAVEGFSFADVLVTYAAQENVRKVIVYHANRQTNVRELSLLDGWHQTDNDAKVSEFLQAFVCSKVDNSQTVIALPYNYNLQQWHRLAIAIMRLSMFEDWLTINPVTTEEKAILKSLTEDGELFVKMMLQFESGINLAEFRINKYLGGWITDVKRSQIERLESDYRYYTQNISEYQTRLQEAIKKMRDIAQKVSMLQSNMQNEADFETELKEFLLHMPNITLRYKSGDTLYYAVYDRFVLHDEDKEMLETFISNNGSILYEYNYGYSQELLKKFYTEVFLKERWRMKCCASFSINNLAEARTYNEYDTKVHKNMYFPNPHLHHYDCLGGHTAMLTDAAQSLDYIGAMLITQQATSNLNWSDGIVMERFIKDMFDRYTDMTCYEDANGELFTIGEVLDELKAELQAAAIPTVAQYTTYPDDEEDEEEFEDEDGWDDDEE